MILTNFATSPPCCDHRVAHPATPAQRGRISRELAPQAQLGTPRSRSGGGSDAPLAMPWNSQLDAILLRRTAPTFSSTCLRISRYSFDLWTASHHFCGSL